MAKRYIQGIESDSLIVRQCPCGHLNIYGFWHQLPEKTVSADNRFVSVPLPCSECGKTKTERYSLSTGKRRRLIDWLAVAWSLGWLIFRLPVKARMRFIEAFFWLHHRVTI